MNLQVQGRRPPAAVILPLIIVGIFTLLRFNQSLWIDEGASIWFARLPLDKLFTSICEPVTPLYHLVLRAFLAVNDTEAWLRLPSLLAGLLAILVIYRLSLEICGTACAGLAAMLLALQPLHSWYASEIRMHTFGESLGLVAVWLGYRTIAGSSERSASWFGWATYILAATLALWVDYTAFLAWGILQLIWLANGRPRAWHWIGAQAIVLLLVAFRITPNQLVSMSNNLYPIFIAIRANSLGINLTPTAVSILLQLAAVVGVLACLGLAVYWRYQRFDKSPRIQWMVIGLWVALVLWAVLPQAYTVKRRLIIVVPYLALTAAYFTALQPRRIRLALVLIGTAATLTSVVTLQREPWQSVVEDVLAAKVQPPAIAWVDDMAAPPFDYYWRRAGSPEALQWLPLSGRALPQTPQLAPPPTGTLWVVVAESPYRHLLQFLPADFYANYQLITARHETGIGVYQYQRRAQPDPTALPPLDRSPADAWELLLPSPLDTCTR